MSLLGLFGCDSNFLYGFNVDYEVGSESMYISGGVNVMYCGLFVEVSGSVGVSVDFQQFLLGLCGVVVVYQGGIMFFQLFLEMFVIVKVLYVEGVCVMNMIGV